MTCEYTAKGYAHRYNCLKVRILDALYYYYPSYATADMIAEYTGQQVHTITNSLSEWFSRHYKYCSRRRVKGYYKQKYEFKLRKPGLEALLDYKNRLVRGYDLNRNKRVPIKVDQYVIVTKRGRDMCIDESILPDIRDILKK